MKLDKKTIIVVALIVALLMMATVAIIDADQTEYFGDEKGETTLSGMMTAYSAMVDNVGNIVWSSADEDSGFAHSVVDPTSGLEVDKFYMGIRYECTGNNIDWSTMAVRADWQFKRYSSPNAFTAGDPVWNSDEVKGQQNGDLESTKIALDPLVPESITMEYKYSTNGGVPPPETFAQRTTESHPIQLSFQGRYYVEVFDSDGNRYEHFFEQNVKLVLQWGGCDSGLVWQDPFDDEPDTPTSVAPTINHIGDVATEQYNAPIFTWTTDDMNGDIIKYTISIDDVVVTESAFSGGALKWGHKFPNVGRFNIRVVVEDAAGHTCQDEVEVIVFTYIELKPTEGDDDVTDPIDPSIETHGEQTFDEHTDDEKGIPVASLFGGQSGNTQVLVILGIAGGAAWLLYNRKKR